MPEGQPPPAGRLRFALAVLFGINFMNFYDRQIVGAIGERIKQDWALSDSQLGLLTTAFVLLYAAVGVPLGRWADTGRRRVILAVSVLLWSGFTLLCGLAAGFVSLFVFRLGVGVGEAGCAPAANSLIGDLFPAERRARAISVFMLGLPLGLAASYLLSGWITQLTGGWRQALFVAAAPGVVLGLLALALPEPARGAADRVAGGAVATGWAAIRAVLKVPTMRWIIASGAILNLNMYALGTFLTSFLIRYHGLQIGLATTYSGIVIGLGGGLGMVLGGQVGDRLGLAGARGRLRLAMICALLAGPIVAVSLAQPRGMPLRFVALLLPAYLLFYVYYSAVYAAIQDVIGPRARGTAMAVYFFVFYLFTAAGLYSFGWLSDRLAAGNLARGLAAPEASALGLHRAMYLIPALAVALAMVLWAAARTAPADEARLRAAPVS